MYGRNDRAKSVTHVYDYDNDLGVSKRSNMYNSRCSVGRFIDDESDSRPMYISTGYRTRSSITNLTNKRNTSNNDNKTHDKIDRSSTSKYKYNRNQSPDLDKTAELEMRMSLAPEHSVTPTPENLD